MAGRKPRWPTLEEILEDTKKGIIDDREAAIPPFDLEDWEILGEPAPEDAAAEDPKPASRRSRKRKAS